jgi:CBS domain-containing protein
MMHVRELLRKKSADVVTVQPNTDVLTAVQFLISHNIGGLPVVTADGSLVGFVSERDVVKGVETNSDDLARQAVDRIMQRPPICYAGDTLHEVMSRMTRDRLRHLVVIDEGRTVGVISVGDLVKQRLEELELETGTLRDYVAAQRAAR